MCTLRGTCNSRGAYNRSDQQRRIPAEYLDYLGRIYFWFTGGCAITWGARGGGVAGESLKAAVYGISYSNNRGHIYKRTSVTRTQVNGFELSGRSIMHYYSDDWV